MDEKYRILFENVTNNVPLTTKNLNEMGYKKPSRLIDEGVLIREKRGFYALANIIDLFWHGMRLKENDMEAYHKVMLRCVELDSSFGSAIFQLFVYALRNKDYEASFQYLLKLMELNNPLYEKDYNLYLLLLSRIMELPEEYQEKAKKLNVFDIYVSNKDRRFKDRKVENIIRKDFYDEEYGFAMSLTKKFSYDGSTKIVYFQFLRKFFIKAQKDNSFYSFLDAAKNHQYLELKQYLDSLEVLNSKDNILKKLVDTYLEIANSRIIPEIIPYNGNNYGSAAQANDFLSALTFMNELPKKEENPAYYLLVDINNLIGKIKEEEQRVISLDDVLKALISNDNYILVLDKYLKQLNKSEYEPLFLALIKLSLWEKDTTFNNVLYHLVSLSNNNLTINFSAYLNYFNEALQNNSFDEARIHLEIIRTGSILKLNDWDINGLEISLSDKEKQYKMDMMIATITTAVDDVVNKKGVAILDKNDVEDSMLKAYTNGHKLLIEHLGDKIIIRYFEHQYVDIGALVHNANYFYNSGDYKACIECCMILLTRVEKLKSFVYKLLGLSYYKLGILEEAKKFLTIAHLTGDFNYTILIGNIDKQLREEKEIERKRLAEET